MQVAAAKKVCSVCRNVDSASIKADVANFVDSLKTSCRCKGCEECSSFRSWLSRVAPDEAPRWSHINCSQPVAKKKTVARDLGICAFCKVQDCVDEGRPSSEVTAFLAVLKTSCRCSGCANCTSFHEWLRGAAPTEAERWQHVRCSQPVARKDKTARDLGICAFCDVAVTCFVHRFAFTVRCLYSCKP